VSVRSGAGAAVASQQLKAPPARPLRGSPTGPQRRVTPLVQTLRRAQPHARVALAGRVTPARRLAPPRRPCAPGLPAWVPHPAAAGCVAVRGCPTVGLAVLQVLLMLGIAPISTLALDPSSRSYLIRLVLNRTRHVLPQSTIGPTTLSRGRLTAVEACGRPPYIRWDQAVRPAPRRRRSSSTPSRQHVADTAVSASLPCRGALGACTTAAVDRQQASCRQHLPPLGDPGSAGSHGSAGSPGLAAEYPSTASSPGAAGSPHRPHRPHQMG